MTEDVPDSLAKRKEVRSKHLARLVALKQENRLLVAGPHPAVDKIEPGEAGFTGSLIIAEFASLEHAKLWAAQDPYMDVGVVLKVLVKPYQPVLP